MKPEETLLAIAKAIEVQGKTLEVLLGRLTAPAPSEQDLVREARGQPPVDRDRRPHEMGTIAVAVPMVGATYAQVTRNPRTDQVQIVAPFGEIEANPTLQATWDRTCREAHFELIRRCESSAGTPGDKAALADAVHKWRALRRWQDCRRPILLGLASKPLSELDALGYPWAWVTQWVAADDWRAPVEPCTHAMTVAKAEAAQ